MRRLFLLALLSVLVLACAEPAKTSRDTTGAPQAAAKPAGVKRIVVGIRGTPVSPIMKVTLGGGSGQAPGAEELEELVNSRLGMIDPSGTVRPYLASSIPSVQDGSWSVQPDGSMVTTWKIRPNAKWHDGHPFTADDVVFSYTVWTDAEVGIFRDARYLTVQSVEAPDP